jgi:hypothetical protein
MLGDLSFFPSVFGTVRWSSYAYESMKRVFG